MKESRGSVPGEKLYENEGGGFSSRGSGLALPEERILQARASNGFVKERE